MEYRESARDRYYSYNSLVGLVQAIQGQQTTVDLRNGHSATGRIEFCDSFMNVEMSNVLFRDGTGKPHIFENFFIHSRNVRYVHIPPEVSINMRKVLEKFYEKKFAKPVQEPVRQTHRQLRNERRHAETLEHIQKMREAK